MSIEEWAKVEADAQSIGMSTNEFAKRRLLHACGNRKAVEDTHEPADLELEYDDGE